MNPSFALNEISALANALGGLALNALLLVLIIRGELKGLSPVARGCAYAGGALLGVALLFHIAATMSGNYYG